MILSKFTDHLPSLPTKLPPTFYYTVGGIFGFGVVLSLCLNLRTRRHRMKKSLKGKVVLITGATAGIGKAAAKELAKQGATIHLLCRDLRRGELVAKEIKRSTGNQEIFVHFVNLSDFTTVRMFVKKFLATGSNIDILINNAGIINMSRKITVDGLEETLQANYLSHFLLTNLLLERIIKSSPSRIINVSSIACQFVHDFDPRDMNRTRSSISSKHSWSSTYAWSKFEQVVWTRELARRLYGKGVTVNSLHPGAVRTSLMREVPKVLMLLLMPIGWSISISPYLGAQTILYLAESDEVRDVTGQYFDNCRPTALNIRALDDQLATELWWESEQLTNIRRY